MSVVNSKCFKGLLPPLAVECFLASAPQRHEFGLVLILERKLNPDSK